MIRGDNMTSKLLAFLTAVQTAVTGVVGLGTDGNDKFIVRRRNGK